MKDLSIIILSHNTQKLTLSCVKSVLERTKGIDYEIIVVDNKSSDGSLRALKRLSLKHTNLRIIQSSKNLGFSRGNNLGVKRTKSRYILFLNSDTKLNSNVLGEMTKWMDRNEKVGLATCSLLNSDGTVQGTGGYFPTLIRVFSWMTIQDLPFVDSFIKPFHPMKAKTGQSNKFYEKKRELDWVTGAFMLVRGEVFKDTKGFDTDYFMYTEDVDLCYRIRQASWRIMYLPKWTIVHFGGASATTAYSVLKEYEGIKLFYKKHFPAWKYQLLRLFLKIGAAGRIVVFGFLQGKEAARTYAKAFKIA